jgi:hypothetical protein
VFNTGKINENPKINAVLQTLSMGNALMNHSASNTGNMEATNRIAESLKGNSMRGEITIPTETILVAARSE